MPDPIRDQLIEAAKAVHYSTAEARDIADVLLPVVESYAAQQAAQALRNVVREDRTTMEKLSPVERLTCFMVKAEDLFTRAAALDPKEDPR